MKTEKWWLMAGWRALTTAGCVLLAWKIWDQTTASGAVTGSYVAQRADQTSVYSHTLSHTHRNWDTRKPGLHLSHYNDALGCVTQNFSGCTHVFPFCLMWGEFSQGVIVTHRLPGTCRQLQGKTRRVKAWNFLSPVCKHVSFIPMGLWFQNQYQISARRRVTFLLSPSHLQTSLSGFFQGLMTKKVGCVCAKF